MYPHYIQTQIGLPEIKLKKDDGNTATFIVSPLPRGFGTTLGNTLRRTLISSICGFAIVGIQADELKHEFTSIAGIRESGLELILNLRDVRLNSTSEDPFEITLEVNKEGKVKASDFKLPSGVEIANPDLIIAHVVDKKINLKFTAHVERGVGFKTAEENNRKTIGFIALDSLFSPVISADMTIEPTRVGALTDLDSLEIQVETDGTISPEDAIKSASNMLRYYFGLFDELAVPHIDKEITDDIEISNQEETGATDEYVPIETLPISSRTANSLINGGIISLEQLYKCSRKDLVELKGFGKKGLEEVENALIMRGFNLLSKDDKKEELIG